MNRPQKVRQKNLIFWGIFVSIKKHDYEKRLKAVLAVIEDYRSMSSVAKEMGIDSKEVRRLVAFYKQFGKDGLSIKNGRYSAEFKLSVIRHMEENDLSYFKTAVMFGIPCGSVIRRWNRIYNEKGVIGVMPKNQGRNEDISSDKSNFDEKTKKELLKELVYLRAENAYLKKLQALVQEREALENGKKQKPSKN